jgi:hypothetical protein
MAGRRDGIFRTGGGCVGSSCVEVAFMPGGGVRVRDSKNPAGGVQAYDEGEWDAFVAGVKSGDFDVPD